MSKVRGLGADEQWEKLRVVATDTRPRVATGWDALDALLHRNSLGPGTMCLFGGRIHTRKTAVILNLIANLLKADVPVGLVGLDEPPHMYVVKLASVLSGVPASQLEIEWESDETEAARQAYMKVAHRLTMTDGSRPSFSSLTKWLDDAEVDTGVRPRVVFIDYLKRLGGRTRFAGKDAEYIPQLAEDLAEWTNQQELVTIAVHHAGKTDEGANRKYHGDQPMTIEQLRFAVDEPADLVFATFRPELDPVGNMTQAQAQAEGIELDEWQDAADRVNAERDKTYLQLLKNRPGTKLERKGIALRSIGESQRMVPTDQEVNESMELQS